MFQKHFYWFLLCITVIGLILRLNHYESIPPFGQTRDEFIYPWIGMSLIQQGIPITWSDFASYPTGEIIEKWGVNWRFVSPSLEKPPLYSLIIGGFSLLAGFRDFFDVRLSVIRLIPIFLSGITIALTAILGKKAFNASIGLLSAVIVATTPMMVLGHRLSLTENLLTPIALMSLLGLTLNNKRIGLYFSVIGSLLAVLTKQSGIAVAIVILMYFISQKAYKQFFLISLVTILGLTVTPLMGLYYDWDLYRSVTEELRQAHALGLPETIATLFRFPGIAHKEAIFLDGTMLAGFILLLAAPFGLLQKLKKETSWLFLGFPFIYLLVLTFMDAGQTWYGWYLYPLFPFISLVVGYSFYELWKERNSLQLIFFFLITATSSLRFILLIQPKQLAQNWQFILFCMAFLIFGMWFYEKGRFQKPLLYTLLGLYIVINIISIWHFPAIYQTRPQPF